MDAVVPHKIALPKFVAERRSITPRAKTSDWSFGFLDYVGSFFSSSDSTQLHDKVTYLPSTASPEIFAMYVGNMLVELAEASALTPDRVEVRIDCMRRLYVVGLMKDTAEAWMRENDTYEFTPVNVIFQDVQTLRDKVSKAVPVGRYTLPDAPPLEPGAELRLSKVSPGFTNGGMTCYLSSLLQGLIGDPITRRWIINAKYVKSSFRFEDSEKNIREFVRVLKECTFEFEEAQRRERKDAFPRQFILKLRTALDPLVTSINLSRAKQEDPTEVLTSILACLEPEGNPLFSTYTGQSVFNVNEKQAQKLTEGAHHLEAFRVHIETLKIVDVHAVPKEVRAGLMTYLNYLYRDYAAPELDVEDTSEILKAILLKLNEKKDVSGLGPKQVEAHQEKLDKITSEDSLPLLIEQVDIFIADFRSIPTLDLGEWTKAKPTAELVPEAANILKINGDSRSNAFESFIDAALDEKLERDKQGALSSCQYFVNTPSEVRVEVTHSRYTYEETPEHVLFALNRNKHNGNKLKAGSGKVLKKVHLEETFFLDPRFTKDRKGGQYQVRWFCLHIGNGDKGGHYVNYRLTEKGWYCLNDHRSSYADPEEVETALQDCCLIFATRMDKVLTEEQIQRGIEAAVEASHGKDNELKYNKITKAHRSSEAQELDLLRIFSNELSRIAPNVELLKKIFASLKRTEFPAFVTEILTLTNKLEEETPIADQLLELKTIKGSLLTVDLHNHIVEQYVEVREQRRQHALDAIALKNIEEPSLSAAGERAKKILKALTYENQCIGYILDQKDINEKFTFLLLRTLSSSLYAKYEDLVRSTRLPSLDKYLQVLASRNEAHIASATELLEKIEALGLTITIQANELTAAVKAEVPDLPHRREGRKEDEELAIVPPRHFSPREALEALEAVSLSQDMLKTALQDPTQKKLQGTLTVNGKNVFITLKNRQEMITSLAWLRTTEERLKSIVIDHPMPALRLPFVQRKHIILRLMADQSQLERKTDKVSHRERAVTHHLL